MKKKLTVNTLALGNLKQRRKQYTIMIIGIILAMVFSSSIVLFMFSSMETSKQQNMLKYGIQDSAFSTENLTENDLKKAIDDGIITRYGYMHNIGYAYSDEELKQLGAAVSWMEDTADELYNLTLLEGRKPTGADEIAIEKNVLRKLGYKESTVGDKIKLNLDVANGAEFGKTVEKEYTIVGIYDDRNKYTNDGYKGNIDFFTPGIYVAQNTMVEPGGKEFVLALIESNEDATYYSAKDDYTYKSRMATDMYFSALNDEYIFMGLRGYHRYDHLSLNMDNIIRGGDLMAIVICVLVFASCIAIINAFNTNLKERKKQIGLLRAIGTTKRQIINIFGREAFIISLVATPISIIISYILVKTAMAVIGNGSVMTKSIWSLLVAGIADVIVVMLAALIPLFIASRVTPMQAIRNVDASRKAKNKKIKSKKNFAPASHIAKRSMKFYKGGVVAVSIMLTVTICFSCVAFSFVTNEANNIYQHTHDYELDNLSDYESSSTTGMTEIERQEITALPYVKATYGQKVTRCALEFNEIDDFLKIMDYQTYEYSGDFEPVRNNDELKKNLEQTTTKEYEQKKANYNIKKEMVETQIRAYDVDELKAIENCLTDGTIDYDKLASGEEVILVAPQKVELIANIRNNYYAVAHRFDDNVGKIPANYESIMQATSNLKVGDELNISVGTFERNENDGSYTVISVEKRTAKIGAIVSPAKLGYYKNGISAQDFSVLTTVSGINNFEKGITYSTLSFDVNDEIDDDTDERITEDMLKYCDKYDGWFMSNYDYTNSQRQENERMILALIAIVIIGFSICISIINNSISAQIRENKNVIGTLRAVGADQRELSKSYTYQMLLMFGWGTGFGYGLFLAILGVIKLVAMKTGSDFSFVFNPWITVAMTVVSFIMCSLNVFSKVRKEMKNSIVENIREL